MKRKAYIETTVISYLVSRDSRDIVLLAHQQVTREWWNSRARQYDLYASQLVVEEARQGDSLAAAKRLAILETLKLLVPNEEAARLAEKLVDPGPLPATALDDALHIAVATTNGMDYLITWNCRHIANAAIRNDIEQVCRLEGYSPPTITTPIELVENGDDTGPDR